MKLIKIIIVGFILVFLVSCFFPYILFPSDILNYLPSFSIDKWSMPHNSLLADPVFQFEPWRIFAKQSLMSGNIPFWNSANAGGTPFLANPQTAVFYPLNFIYYFLPPNISLNLISYLKLSLYFLFIYLYLKSIKCSTALSYLGGFMGVFASFPILWLLWPHTNVFILLPLLLFLTEKIKTGKDRFFFLITITYLVGVLGGHPETLFHLTAIHIAYSLFKFRKQIFIFAKEFVFIILGFLLSAFMILPFVEYVFNSDLLYSRIQNSTGYFLPLKGIIYNIFPFFFGAPNFSYYRSPFQGTNFQELSGGYVGPAILIVVIIGVIKYWKNNYIRFFAVLILILSAIVYKIWPVWLITKLPLISSIANQRLIGFIGFFIVILFTLVIQNIAKADYSLKTKRRLALIISIFSIIMIIALTISMKFLTAMYPQQADKYLPILFFNCIVFICSTAAYLYLFFKISGSKRVLYSLTIFVVLIQAVLFFINYNTLTKKGEYYPQNDFTRKLETLPKGTFIEVGNPLFPANLNLVYHQSQAQSDDAIGVGNYTKQFGAIFKEKNIWGRVNEISLSGAKKLGIDYVISDYDINLDKSTIQPKIEKIITPTNDSLSVKFKGDGRGISQIRLLPANFNRLNTCKILVKLKDQTKTVLITKTLLCQDMRDKMFYTFPIGKLDTVKDMEYSIEISLVNTGRNNTVGFWGSNSSAPYVEILFADKPVTFKKIWNKGSVFIFSVHGNSLVDGLDMTKIRRNTATSLIINGNKIEEGIVTIKKTRYPGWKVAVDNKPVVLRNDAAFFSFWVPEGEHVISLQYVPLSFYVGFIISILTFMGILLFYLYKIKKITVKFEIFKLSTVSKLNFRVISLISFGISIVLYKIVDALKLLKSSFVDSGSINWLNAKHYQKTADFMMIFAFFVLNIIVFICVFCSIYLWKAKKK